MANLSLSPAQLSYLQAIFSGQNAENAELVDSPLLQLFESLGETEQAEYATNRICQPGEIIVQEGGDGDCVYLIRSGRTVVLKGDLAAPKIIGLRHPGGLIGEMSLLDHRPRSASVVALDHVILLSLSREGFNRILSHFPIVSQQMLGVLSARLRQADDERSLENALPDDQMAQMIQGLREQATHDGLTGLYNRRHLEDSLVQQIAKARQEKHPLSVLMIDLDHFKQVNDSYGHLAGDQILRTLGALIQGSIREVDIACRYGGEEFCVLMPGATLDTAAERGEHIRAAFETLAVHIASGEIRATLSIGVAAYPEHGASNEAVLARADQALYEAKTAGRNCVVVG